MLKIRNETETDYREVETLTRKAFYNLYIPGCVEHYLVHVMRGHNRSSTLSWNWTAGSSETKKAHLLYTKQIDGLFSYSYEF
jgi:predicted N-acetyltransferase YhbS